ncbi:MAG: zinc ribbon domain-containing protein [Anaerolineales bacterium]|nr:zinc ribbon domain-containing protein [Anaerolineales bacterium]
MPLQLNLSTLDGLLLYATAIFAGFLAALWLGLIFWTQRDIRARSRDRLVHILAPLLVAFLNLPGVVIYLILRPPRTLDEEYQHTLEEEALLTEIEDSPVCPGCGSRTQADWQICPTCHTRLRKACARCQRLMELPWKLCPYCGTPAPGVRAEAGAGAPGIEFPPV